MIIARLDGGLGNQLFQYAAARRLALKRNTALALDLSNYGDPRGVYGLDRFRTSAWVIPRGIRILGPEGDRQEGAGQGLHIHREVPGGLDRSVFDLPNNSYLIGYFQSEQYFADAEEAIRRELTFTIELAGAAGEVGRRIRESRNAVSLHVRRGDYALLPEFGVLDLSYYKKAVGYARQRLGTVPDIFVFSDDPDWCRENLQIGVPFEIVSPITKQDRHADLVLMSACRHNIIANSSFSWWGAWLNRNQDQIVVAPSTWFASWSDGGSIIIPPRWVRI